MKDIIGTVEKVNMKPTKHPEWTQLGVCIEGTWYNSVTKFPDGAPQAGYKVTFVSDDENKVQGFIKTLNKGDGSQVPAKASKSPLKASSGSTHNEGSSYQKHITSILERLSDIESLLTVIKANTDETAGYVDSHTLNTPTGTAFHSNHVVTENSSIFTKSPKSSTSRARVPADIEADTDDDMPF